MTHPFDRKLQTIVSTVLRAGIAASGGCLLVGAVLMLLRPAGSGADWSYAPLLRLPARDLLVSPLAWLYLGILLLMATPVARVLVTILSFVVERDWRYVVISAIVLAVITLSITLAFLL